MSNTLETTEQPCTASPAPCAAIETVLQPRERDLGGFSVRRVLPTAQRRMVGPWIFFDHMGPAHFPAGEGINVRPHPHIGIATVTYLFEGEILHRDSLGSLQAIRPGDLNLMVAGHGIVHSERERPEISAREHTQHGLQLWLALPEADEETDPAFHHYPEQAIPTVTVDGIPVRVMMGSVYGEQSPVRVFSETLYLEARLQPGQTLTLPDADERAVYVVSGELRAQDTAMPTHSMTIFSHQSGIAVTATTASTIALVGGAPVGERHIEWNFVSSRRERIEQAKQDWQDGRFPKVPGDEHEFIPLP
ncbi:MULTISPECIES: pirin family protein [unclassified Thioalkalivibrio]|uniref:pirin family protein n=1 Tax=unclassified Thioalkalivibrio TaxID=2621013 RepID=UPI00036B734C|nr:MULTISPECIES: pirin family protein [unclassified Thioalkalivibrio]